MSLNWAEHCNESVRSRSHGRLLTNKCTINTIQFRSHRWPVPLFPISANPPAVLGPAAQAGRFNAAAGRPLAGRFIGFLPYPLSNLWPKCYGHKLAPTPNSLVEQTSTVEWNSFYTLSLLLFFLLIVLFSLPLPLLCFSSVHIVGSLTSKLPSNIWIWHVPKCF